MNEICGEFKAHELSVIMGPSGSGKSSLLNILTGFTTRNVTGSLMTNGSTQNYKRIRHESAYIMQDESLYTLLTVRESMNFAIKFKTGDRLTPIQQEFKRESILKQLGLQDTINTMVQNLSGGQQKRLSIAIELVSDPKILFLDEPTTGLDSSSSAQCIQLLKKLAHEGKTIICSIHTPSALLFEKFDHLYVLARGYCIYQGASKNVVPFLSEVGLVCPESYNPADYILEISTNDYGLHNNSLTELIRNGANTDFRKQSKYVKDLVEDIDFNEKHPAKHAASFLSQLLLLIQRNIILMQRDMSFAALRLFVSLFVAVIVGVLFYNIGNLASHMFDNYKYAYLIPNFLTYASYFSLMVRCELPGPVFCYRFVLLLIFCCF